MDKILNLIVVVGLSLWRQVDRYATEEAKSAFFRNFKSLRKDDLLSYLKVNPQVGTEENPITEELLREYLVEGVIWRDEFASDGDPVNCGRCSKIFQPIVIPRGEGERPGGNFKTVRVEEIDKLAEEVRARGGSVEVVEEVRGLLDGITKKALGIKEIPNSLRARAFPSCPRCKAMEMQNLQRRHKAGEDVFFPPYCTFADLGEVIRDREERIASGIAERARRAAFSGTAGSATATRGRTLSGDRPKVQVAWPKRGDVQMHIYPWQAESLTNAGYNSVQEVADTPPTRLQDVFCGPNGDPDRAARTAGMIASFAISALQRAEKEEALRRVGGGEASIADVADLQAATLKRDRRGKRR